MWLFTRGYILLANTQPIGSMYGIYANIWGILMVNVTIYSIHGSMVKYSKIRNVLGLGFCEATNCRDAPGSWRVLATTCALRRTPRRPSSPPIGYGGPVIPMVCSGFINMFLIEIGWKIGKTLGSCPVKSPNFETTWGVVSRFFWGYPVIKPQGIEGNTWIVNQTTHPNSILIDFLFQLRRVKHRDVLRCVESLSASPWVPNLWEDLYRRSSDGKPNAMNLAFGCGVNTTCHMIHVGEEQCPCWGAEHPLTNTNYQVVDFRLPDERILRSMQERVAVRIKVLWC